MSSVTTRIDASHRDTFNSALTDGSRVMDHGREVGYLRLDPGQVALDPARRTDMGTGPVARTRDMHPWREVVQGERVEIIRGDFS